MKNTNICGNEGLEERRGKYRARLRGDEDSVGNADITNSSHLFCMVCGETFHSILRC